MTTAQPRQQLRGISYKQGDFWMAVCLDRYLMTFAATPEALRARIHEMFLTHIEASLEEGRRPFECLPRAPQRYWDLWDAAEGEPEVRETLSEHLVGAAYPDLVLKNVEQPRVAA